MRRPFGERITVDTDRDQVWVQNAKGEATYRVGPSEAFAAISRVWLRSGWDNKHVYSFTWLGRPIIQLPEDMIRIQEVIYRPQPDVIVETGIAHGGCFLFYASLCKLMGAGCVIGIDKEIRPHNRAAIEAHPLASLITLIELDSVDPVTIVNVRTKVPPNARTMALLDSCHTKEHVLAEVNACAELVSPGSYIVAMDGIMQDVAGAPRSQPDWTWHNPQCAAREFVKEHPNFCIEEPA